MKRLLGVNSPWKIALFVLFTCGLSMFAFFIVQYFSYQKMRSRELKALTPLLNKLRKRGYERLPSQTMQEFLEIVARENPSWMTYLEPVISHFNLCVYGAKEAGYKSNFLALKKSIKGAILL